MKSVAAIVLAAGRSRRMGTQKLLLSLAGQTVIAGVVDAVLASAVRHTLVVLGQGGPLIREALGRRPVGCVLNPDPDGDMLSSVRCGLRAVPPDAEAVLLVPGDQAGITTAMIDTLLRALPAGTPGLVVPTHLGRRGHPLLFTCHYTTEILQHHDGVGVRGLLRAHATNVIEVPLQEHAVLHDLDTPADYQRLRDRLDER